MRYISSFFVAAHINFVKSEMSHNLLLKYSKYEVCTHVNSKYQPKKLWKTKDGHKNLICELRVQGNSILKIIDKNTEVVCSVNPTQFFVHFG